MATTLYCVIAAVILLHLSSFLLASPTKPKNTISNGDENLLQPDDLFNQQMKDLHNHCSRPQKEVLDVYQVLKGDYKGLLSGGYYTVFHEGDYELFPSDLLVDRCDIKCNDAGSGMTCKAVEEKNVQRVFNFQDQNDEIHVIRINEHTECKCIKAS